MPVRPDQHRIQAPWARNGGMAHRGGPQAPAGAAADAPAADAAPPTPPGLAPTDVARVEGKAPPTSAPTSLLGAWDAQWDPSVPG